MGVVHQLIDSFYETLPVRFGKSLEFLEGTLLNLQRVAQAGPPANQRIRRPAGRDLPALMKNFSLAPLQPSCAMLDRQSIN